MCATLTVDTLTYIRECLRIIVILLIQMNLTHVYNSAIKTLIDVQISRLNIQPSVLRKKNFLQSDQDIYKFANRRWF